MKWPTDRLGPLRYPSPLNLSQQDDDYVANFVDDDARVIVDGDWHQLQRCISTGGTPEYFELSGPRANLFFQPERVRAAIVTCGGLCPGLNNVIRGLVMQLFYHYGVRDILGVRYGFQGMTVKYGGTAIALTPEVVENIHAFGGSYLGSSRGPQSSVELADFLQRRSINMLFVIGGDGSLRGARAILDECRNRGYEAAIVGIPKTIDNDIEYIDRSFGFNTAVEKASEVLACAHVEARGAMNGIGLVKLMGRYSGYIASRATLASGTVNCVLIPELPFDLHGRHGFLTHLEMRLKNRGHAVVAVAEGAGQHLFALERPETDASGNPRLNDIGVFLRETILDHFARKEIAVTLKYFDPSYIIRSASANTEDNIYCTELAQHAVHTAFAGRTGVIVGMVRNAYVMIPLDVVTAHRRIVDTDGPEWLAVLQSTGQAITMMNDSEPETGHRIQNNEIQGM